MTPEATYDTHISQHSVKVFNNVMEFDLDFGV